MRVLVWTLKLASLFESANTLHRRDRKSKRLLTAYRSLLTDATAAHKMHDLNAVVIVKQSRCPVITTNDIAVEFNGDPRGVKTERRYQRVDG
jgi:hypothetical protein